MCSSDLKNGIGDKRYCCFRASGDERRRRAEQRGRRRRASLASKGKRRTEQARQGHPDESSIQFSGQVVRLVVSLHMGHLWAAPRADPKICIAGRPVSLLRPGPWPWLPAQLRPWQKAIFFMKHSTNVLPPFRFNLHPGCTICPKLVYILRGAHLDN